MQYSNNQQPTTTNLYTLQDAFRQIRFGLEKPWLIKIGDN